MPIKPFLITCILVCSNLFAQQDIDTLKIGVYESPPFVIFSDSEKIEGISGWLWHEIEKEIDRPYKVIKYTSDEPLIDIVYDLEKGLLDLSINPITITSSRDKTLAFSYPFFIGDLSIAKKKKSNIESFFQILESIFNKRIIALIIILIIMVFLFGFLTWTVEKKNHHFERNFRGFLSSIWWSVVTMTTVGYGDKVPISQKGRAIAVLWMICSLILISIFTATITSNLTVRQLANTDYSLSDFKQNRIGTVEGSATEEFLERNFFRNIVTYPEFLNGLTALHKEEIELFVYDRSWLMYQIEYNLAFQSLEVLPLRFKMQHYSMPMRRDLDEDLQKTISFNILKSVEMKEWELLLNEYSLKQD